MRADQLTNLLGGWTGSIDFYAFLSSLSVAAINYCKMRAEHLLTVRQFPPSQTLGKKSI
jgi:hypothetical protein